MINLKKFISGRRAEDYIVAAAGIVMLAAVILYACTGEQPAFNVTVSGEVIAVAVIAIVLGYAAAVLHFQALYFLACLLNLHVFLQFIVTQLRYISNVLVAIDGTTFTPAFICTAVLMAIVWLASLAAAIIAAVKGGRAQKAGAADAQSVGGEEQS